MALTFGLTSVFQKSSIQSRVFSLQCFNQVPTGGRISGINDIGPARGKPFFLLELDPIPRWVTQHDVKATTPLRFLVLRLLTGCWYTEHIGERQVPVEELIL